MTTPATIRDLIETSVGKKIRLRINNNRTTMLSVRWDPDCTSISMHQMFLQAPEEVMQQLVSYLKRDHKQMAPDVKAYINDHLEKLDYSDRLDRSRLETKGLVYNLQDLYDAVNHEYFENSLDLAITWFGRHRQKNRARVTFGLYHDQMRLIKIHRRMDDISFPEYFVTFVMYHEMLHHTCRPYTDGRGVQHVHTREFKEKEKLFRYYDLAQLWLKNNRKTLFNDYRGNYGWA